MAAAGCLPLLRRRGAGPAGGNTHTKPTRQRRPGEQAAARERLTPPVPLTSSAAPGRAGMGRKGRRSRAAGSPQPSPGRRQQLRGAAPGPEPPPGGARLTPVTPPPCHSAIPPPCHCHPAALLLARCRRAPWPPYSRGGTAAAAAEAARSRGGSGSRRAGGTRTLANSGDRPRGPPPGPTVFSLFYK